MHKVKRLGKIYINKDNRTVEERFENKIQFGNLIVKEYIGHRDGRDWWECLCSCGTTTIVSANRLLKGNTKSCGCLQPQIASKLNRAELIGKRFGRLVIDSFYDIANEKARWFTKCDCGGTAIVTTGSLHNGFTKSCGCLQIEVTIKRSTIHGNAKRDLVTPEYRAWQHMIQRCTNPNDKAYPDYGGRNITVCKRWLESFENFITDMGLRPKGTSLDRIDNDLLINSYSKDNCRWATKNIQNRNQRISVKSVNYDEHQYWLRKFSNNLVHIFIRGDRSNKFCEKYIGCTVEQFKKYIESLWEPWMNWSNRGSYLKINPNKVWHIEHIKPCHDFDLSKEKDRLECFNYKNLRPYEGLANLQKH